MKEINGYFCLGRRTILDYLFLLPRPQWDSRAAQGGRVGQGRIYISGGGDYYTHDPQKQRIDISKL